MKTIPGRLLGLLWTASVLVTLASLAAAHEQVSIRAPTAMTVVAAILTAGWVRFELRDATRRQARVARDLAEYVGLFMAMALIGTVASYPASAMTSGLNDAALMQADRLIGFDWISWYRMVAAHPLLQLTGRAAYQSIFVSPAILLVHYACAGRAGEARQFLLATWIGAVGTLLLFPCFVALGPLACLWQGPIPYLPASALDQLELIPALRAHTIGTIDVGALRGLVEAPSFHTASGVLYMAFAWREVRLRWPLVLLNAAMLLATPVEGTHYLIDMILGVLVAVGAIAATKAIAALASGGGILIAVAPYALARRRLVDATELQAAE